MWCVMDSTNTPAPLRFMRGVALGFLVAAGVIFVGADWWLHQGGPGWLGFVRAAAEAGVVGGLADWFAVTALFRHPMGLPIPHTALIPRRKKDLGKSLAAFVEEHFLNADALTSRLESANVPRRLGVWLRSRAGAATVDRECAPLLVRAVSAMRQDTVRGVLAQILRTRVSETEVSPVLGRLLDEVLRDGAHRMVVTQVCVVLGDWLTHNKSVVTDAVRSRAPDWTPSFVDDLVSQRLHRELVKFCADVAASTSHPVRGHVDQVLADLAVKLREDPDVRARVERAKENLANRVEVQDAVADVVSAGRRIVLEMLADPMSVLRVQFRALVQDVGVRLSDDDRFAAAAQEYLVGAVTGLAQRHSSEVTALITETIDRWDGKQAATRIEHHVGRDLQFIRINGTIVGALVGLVLYSVSLLW